MSVRFDFMRRQVEEAAAAEESLAARYGARIEDWSEDGSLYVARGFVHPRRFVALLRRWAIDVWGCDRRDPWIVDLRVADVQQSYAAPDPDDEFDAAAWQLDVGANAPGAIAITWVEQ